METPRPSVQDTCFRLQSQWPVRKFFGLLLECPCEPEGAASRLIHDRARRRNWDEVEKLSLDPAAVPDEALLRGLIGADESLMGHAPVARRDLALTNAKRGAVAAGRVQSCEGTNHQMEGRPRRWHSESPSVSSNAGCRLFIDTRVEYNKLRTQTTTIVRAALEKVRKARRGSESARAARRIKGALRCA